MLYKAFPLALLAGADALQIGMAASGVSRAAAPQMGVGLVYSTTTGEST